MSSMPVQAGRLVKANMECCMQIEILASARHPNILVSSASTCKAQQHPASCCSAMPWSCLLLEYHCSQIRQTAALICFQKQHHSSMALAQGKISEGICMQAYMGCCHVEGQTMLITEYMDEGDLWAALARPDSEYTWHRRYSHPNTSCLICGTNIG